MNYIDNSSKTMAGTSFNKYLSDMSDMSDMEDDDTYRKHRDRELARCECDDFYEDSEDEDEDHPHVTCECKRCYQRRIAEYDPEPQDIINAYYERNEQVNQAEPETPEDRAYREDHERELARCDRCVVMMYRGFRVSFPEPSTGKLSSSRQYRHMCPEDERSHHVENVQQLVAQGVWSEEIKKRYTYLIDDFVYSEERSYWETAPSTAFPRHEMLVAASFNSSFMILESHLWRTPLARIRILNSSMPFNCTDREAFMSKSKSKAMTLQPASSVFTETTASQRIKLLAYSGIAGKLAARMLGRGDNCREIQKSAFVMMQRVHSLQTCEIIMDNRYWFTGHPNAKKNDTDEEMPTKKLVEEFRQLYRACIVDLKCVAVKYKRGYIGIDEIHAHPIFARFYSLLLSCLKRMLLIKNEAEKSEMKHLNQVMKFIVEFPDIFHMDVSRVFGLAIMRLRKITRESQLRLAGQGSYSAFLSFAVSEPRMVDEFLAPEICTKYGGILDCDHHNHISSRHKIFGGKLLRKYRHHIPRTAEVLADVCRYSL